MEQYLVQQLLGAGFIWLTVSYLLCLFAVLIFRPQQISSPYLFRLAYILFAVSLILPSLVDALVQVTLLDDGPHQYGRGGAGIGFGIVSPLFGLVGKVLFGLSLICAFSSLRPRGEGGPERPRHIPPANE